MISSYSDLSHVFLELVVNDLYRNFYLVNNQNNLSPVKRICVFEHSVMTNFKCACLAIHRDQGSGFLVEGSS